MTINHQPANTDNSHAARPSLGKACQADLEKAAERISKAGYWSKVIAGRIRTIIIWNGPSSSASETVWHKTADEALEYFVLKSKTEATIKPMPCTRCGYNSDGKDWLDDGATCPKCKLVQPF